MKSLSALILLLAVSLVFVSCEDTGNKGQGKVVTPPLTKFVAVAPPFNADSAFVFVEQQLAFGPRVPNTKEHAACAAWLAEKFRGYGATVLVQTAQLRAWDGTLFDAKNIIATFNPESKRRVMLTAHWDSRPIADQDLEHPTAPVPAANDGGSGVAIILEIARQFSLKAPAVGVDMILWDAEDYGTYDNNTSWCLGSQYWTKNRHQPNYRAQYGINLDMVGAKDARYTKDGYSLQYAHEDVSKVWSIAHKLGYGAYFPMEIRNFSSIDDHYFIQEGAGIPMVEIIDRDVITGKFFPYWHTVKDDISTIDKGTLKATGQTVLEVLFREK
ncbi:MAG TPA: M28 family peptidase [Bacteroidetes bacterium]|nr:M28 family peptidase [Bacteroidota bacterium]